MPTNLNPPDRQSTGASLLNPPAEHSSIHRPNTPQSTGRTLLNPLAQHSSIHWPNTPQSTGPTLLNPPSGHRLNPPSGTLNPPAVQSTHVQSTHGTIWADPPAVILNPPAVRFPGGLGGSLPDRRCTGLGSRRWVELMSWKYRDPTDRMTTRQDSATKLRQATK